MGKFMYHGWHVPQFIFHFYISTKFVSCFKTFIFLNDPFLDMKNV